MSWNNEQTSTHAHTFTLVGDKPIPADFMIDGIHDQKARVNGETSVFVNPYKTARTNLTTIGDVENELARVADFLGWDYWRIERGDVAIDWMKTPYETIQKINRLFLAMIAMQMGIRNAYESISMLAREPLTVRIQNYRYEIEFYNKAIQQPELKVTARLEFRRKGLRDKRSLCEIVREWMELIEEAMTKEVYEKTLEAFAGAVNDRMRATGSKLITVAEANADVIYSLKQLRKLHEISETDGNAEAFAKNFQYRKRPEFITFNEIKDYSAEIVESLKAYAELNCRRIEEKKSATTGADGA